MRKKIVVGNWKLNKNNDEAVELAKNISLSLSHNAPTSVVLCPTAVSLKDLCTLLKDSPIHVGAQNVCHENSGAFTGEISTTTLKELGVLYALIGHSERRQYFGETNDLINKKVNTVLNAGLSPILCIGESLEIRDKGQTEQHLQQQLSSALKNVAPRQLSLTMIAYEPIWAIGTGKTAFPEDIQRTHGFIRNTIANLYDQKIADAILIQYGGSVKPSNAKQILSQNNVDGVLVGGASLSESDFVAIVRESL